MQILVKYDRTYTINDIALNDSINNLQEKILDKLMIPINMQLLMFQGKVINNLNTIADAKLCASDCIHLSVKTRGGSFVSTGNLIVSFLISLAIYGFAYPFIFYGLEFLTANASKDINAGSSTGSSTGSSATFMERVTSFFGNGNALVGGRPPYVLDSLLPGNKSILLYGYLALALIVWVLYSATISMIAYSYFQCQEKNITPGTIGFLVAMFLAYLSFYPLIWWFSQSNRIPFLQNLAQNYSIAIYIAISVIFLVSYYLYALKNYDFNLIYYLILVGFLLFFYYHLITGGDKLSNFTLFGLLPLLGLVFYSVAYLKDYFNIFSKPC